MRVVWLVRCFRATYARSVVLFSACLQEVQGETKEAMENLVSRYDQTSRIATISTLPQCRNIPEAVSQEGQ